MTAPANFSERMLVLGGGPAGAAVAIGLVRLGYGVTLITEPRPFAAVEGISERVVEGLRQAGFTQALELLPEPTPRWVTWSGLTSAANSERLIDRVAFDRALLTDLETSGVKVIQGHVQKLEKVGTTYQVNVTNGVGVNRYSADFLIEARGRRAPASGLDRKLGSETVSMLLRCSGSASTRGSAVESFREGWAWMANTGSGDRYLQLTMDVAHTELPAKALLKNFILERLKRLTQSTPFLHGVDSVALPYARISTPSCVLDPVGDDWIRVGDAAMAVDPLSGNGIFQALSSALQAPAVINTLLHRPQDRDLAKQFHCQRVLDLFNRFARMGRDFYGMEQQWSNEPFWSNRKIWPDADPLHRQYSLAEIEVKSLPVLEDGFITPHEGIVTPDHPMGIWHLGGVPIAPIVRALQRGVNNPMTVIHQAGVELSASQQQLVEQFIIKLQPHSAKQEMTG